MQFYTIQHTFDCGIDLHVDWMYLCVLDAAGEVCVHKNLRTDPQACLHTLKPCREDVVVCAEGKFPWDLARRSLREGRNTWPAWRTNTTRGKP